MAQHPCSLRLPNLNHAGGADGGDGANFVEDLVGDGGIHVHEAQGESSLLVSPQREARDIDAAVAEDRPDAPDHAGNVLVADEEDGAAQRRFNIHVVDAKDAQRPAHADHAEDGIRSGVGLEPDAK